jgi:predicted nucleic acid-binding Zn ribbon protein
MSACFICGSWCDEDNSLCDECAAKKDQQDFARDFLIWLVKMGLIEVGPAYFDDRIIDQWIKQYLTDGGL